MFHLHKLPLLKVALAVVSLVLAGLPWQLQANQTEQLTFAADRWCPFNCKPNSRLPGYAIEIIQRAFSPKYQVNFREMPWTRALRHSEKGVYQGVIGAVNGEAEGFIYPSEAIGRATQVLVMRNDSTWQYQGIESLEELRIAVIANYDYGPAIDSYVSAKQHKRNLVTVRSDQPLVKMHKLLQEGRIDGYIEDKSVASYYSHQQGDNQKIRFAKEFESSLVYIAFSPSNPQSRALSSQLSEAIVAMRETGELEKILARYGLEDWQNSPE
ncbi:MULTISPECIES: substrate-binding periplasmic protein [unclassified Agarivorans]|uniref:substrate-binding periplasmic protein n=1 Tax=unclassified Agarivorans TaxID=2636026 RepID=UPI0026E17419|nr:MULTISPECIES: transporter substrate-binding domain-containing protein [unclassified Agarivorans]MDO6685617.1 transporter substrate-binding domain-containing protein [Agarivorans sp. 3_MG-2023]MDO6716003.1 transporter substrate-binding domain-containing protein [Agarivorans sp. 2_MG-2023]